MLVLAKRQKRELGMTVRRLTGCLVKVKGYNVDLVYGEY